MSINVTIDGLDYDVDVTMIDSPSDIDPQTYIALRGLKGDKGDTGSTGASGQDGQDGQDGADGFSPIATVEKVGDTATITITDINGTTTASISDGSGGGGGASAFVAEYGVTSYADVKDAYDNDSILICVIDDNGNSWVLQLAYFDTNEEWFAFVAPKSDGAIYAILSNTVGWDDGAFAYASQDLATSLRDGLMSALDYQKLAAIESGAEVNVQSDWSQSDNTKDDFIKNKPTLFSGDYNDLSNKPSIPTVPTDVSAFVNDAGYITGYTETDPVFVASVAAGITSSDISAWNNKSDFSGSYNDLTDKPTIPTVNNATLTIQKNGSTVKTFTANASSNVTANITVPTKVSDLTNDSGFITGYTETDPVFLASAAYGISSSDISTWNGKSDFSGSYDDLTNKPTIPDAVSVTQKTSSGTNIASITVGNTTTELYAPSGGGSGGTQVKLVRW